MKFVILFTTILFSISASAASWEALQRSANKQFLNETTVGTRVGPGPTWNEDVTFKYPITKVVLNRIDNPLIATRKITAETLLLATGRDNDDVEIFLYAGDEVLNCYATFVGGVFRDLTNCSKKYKPEE